MAIYFNAQTVSAASAENSSMNIIYFHLNLGEVQRKHIPQWVHEESMTASLSVNVNVDDLESSKMFACYIYFPIDKHIRSKKLLI